MAGIKEALKCVMEHKNEGTIRALGQLEGKREPGELIQAPEVLQSAKYAIIELKDYGGLITQYDYGSDVRIAKGLKVGSHCVLSIKDNWNAEWVKGGSE